MTTSPQYTIETTEDGTEWNAEVDGYGLFISQYRLDRTYGVSVMAYGALDYSCGLPTETILLDASAYTFPMAEAAALAVIEAAKEVEAAEAEAENAWAEEYLAHAEAEAYADPEGLIP